MKPPSTQLPVTEIESLIVTVREQRVILAPDLASVYGVPTKALNQAVKRNADKFPADFMFRLTLAEAEDMQRSRSQVVTLKRGQNIKYLPAAFTEHGAIMAANVLNSPRATHMSVFVVRAFVKMRSAFKDSRQLAEKLTLLEQELKLRLTNSIPTPGGCGLGSWKSLREGVHEDVMFSPEAARPGERVGSFCLVGLKGGRPTLMGSC
jgi:hypothetical protein